MARKHKAKREVDSGIPGWLYGRCNEYGFYPLREGRTWRIYDKTTGGLLATIYFDLFNVLFHFGVRGSVRAESVVHALLLIKRQTEKPV